MLFCFFSCAMLSSQVINGYERKKAFSENDLEVINALGVLESRGFMKNYFNNSSGGQTNNGSSNCIFSLNESALRGTFMQAIGKDTLDNIKKISIDLRPSMIHISGEIKVLFFSPDFSVDLRIETLEDNVIDFTLTKLKISKLSLTNLSGIMFNLIQDRVIKVCGNSVDFTNLGDNEAGDPVLRARIWPEYFTTTFGSSGNLNKISITDSEFKILVTLK